MGSPPLPTLCEEQGHQEGRAIRKDVGVEVYPTKLATRVESTAAAVCAEETVWCACLNEPRGHHFPIRMPAMEARTRLLIYFDHFGLHSPQCGSFFLELLGAVILSVRAWSTLWYSYWRIDSSWSRLEPLGAVWPSLHRACALDAVVVQLVLGLYTSWPVVVAADGGHSLSSPRLLRHSLFPARVHLSLSCRICTA